MKKTAGLLAICLLIPALCLAAKPEKNLYSQAASLLAPIPQTYQQTINDMLRNGWRENETLVKVLTDNAAALAAFKKAALQVNTGYLFGKKQGETNFLPETHDYSKEIQLARLLLLEGRRAEKNNDFKKAEDNYLAAADFLVQLSEQRYGMMLAQLAEFLTFELAYNCFEQSLKSDLFGAGYKEELKTSLSAIRKNQDFMKAAFEEEGAALKRFTRSLENNAKKGASFGTIFNIQPGQADKALSKQYTAKEKELTGLLNSRFFAEFYKLTDAGIEDIFATSIVAARENNPGMIEKKITYYKNAALETGTPVSVALKAFELANKSADQEAIFAQAVAKIYLGISVPNLSKFVEKYYSFNLKLKHLIDTVAH